ncbi:MAG: hypothetical protein WC768_01720 [Patescibacteria group bacterium]|jgi:hypothetical protein
MENQTPTPKPAKFQKLKNYLTGRRFLKLILNLWTIITIVLFMADFFSGNRFDTQSTAIGIIYLGILGVYITEKEYTRWEHKRFISRFLGEGFVGFWSAMMIMFVIIATFSGGQFKIPQDFAVVYTSIVAAFAITQHSKSLYHHKEDEPLVKSRI